MRTWENFEYQRFACRCGCGRNEIDLDTIDLCQALRYICNEPLVVNSGYRCEKHPDEAGKAEPGAHRLGLATDLGVHLQRSWVLNNAIGVYNLMARLASRADETSAREVARYAGLEGERAAYVVDVAKRAGPVQGVGVNQRSGMRTRFFHVDRSASYPWRTRPTVFSYG